MKLVAYYHVYLTDDMGTWSYMVMETMKALEDSGLLAKLDDFRITCVTQADGRDRLFHDLLRTHWDLPYPELKMEIELLRNPHSNDEEMLDTLNSDKTITENYTYRKMWNKAASEDAYYLYIHTKGITSTDRYLRKGNVKKFKMYYYWRHYLTYGTIENWKKCVQALETHDIAGINFFKKPEPHFSGSFWWAKTDYLETLADPATTDWWNYLKSHTVDAWLSGCPDRFRDEMWLCNAWPPEPPKVFNLQHLPQHDNPAATVLPRRYYAQ